MPSDTLFKNGPGLVWMLHSVSCPVWLQQALASNHRIRGKNQSLSLRLSVMFCFKHGLLWFVHPNLATQSLHIICIPPLPVRNRFQDRYRSHCSPSCHIKEVLDIVGLEGVTQMLTVLVLRQTRHQGKGMQDWALIQRVFHDRKTNVPVGRNPMWHSVRRMNSSRTIPTGIRSSLRDTYIHQANVRFRTTKAGNG